MKKYSQTKAMLAVTRASLRSTFRSPSAVVFSIAFPLIFIIVFGFIGKSSMSIAFGINPASDTSNSVYAMMQSRSEIRLVQQPANQLTELLQKGKIAGIINIQRDNTNALNHAPFVVNIQTADTSKESSSLALIIMNQVVDKCNLAANLSMKQVAVLNTQQLQVKESKAIDFILPGMLGFSLLSTGVFGTAFVFFSLRSTLVLKRFFATPIRRPYIVVGEAISRVTFATITSSIIIILGHFAFGFTLVHGPITFVAMLLLSFLGLFVFMGFGFIVSSVAPNETVIPVLANIITLPQFLLAGTFFSTDAFPSWLQPITKILPLTYLNDAMRKVAFEGAHFRDISIDVLVLGIWGVVVYAIAIKVFRWE